MLKVTLISVSIIITYREWAETRYVLVCFKISWAIGFQVLSIGEPLGGVDSSVDNSDTGLLSGGRETQA